MLDARLGGEHTYAPDAPADMVETRYLGTDRTGEVEQEGSARQRSLLKETRSTPWTGIATVGQHLFIAAGSRGLLHVAVTPGGFRLRDPIASAGDRCLDVIAIPGGVVTLVDRAGKRRLNRLSVSSKGNVVERGTLRLRSSASQLVA